MLLLKHPSAEVTTKKSPKKESFLEFASNDYSRIIEQQNRLHPQRARRKEIVK